MTITANINTYRPLLRPASFCTLPEGIKWDYLEVPPDIAMRRCDIPRSAHRYGVIITDRALTADELRHFDLTPY